MKPAGSAPQPNEVPPAPEPAPSANVPIRPVIIHKPIERIIEREHVERTYFEGYRGPVESPTRDTGPIEQFIPVSLSPTEPKTIVINVASPTSPSGERHTYEPARPPDRDTQKERKPDDRDEARVPATPPQRRIAQPQGQERVPDVVAPTSSDAIPDGNNSETIRSPNKKSSPTELKEPDKPAPQASPDGFKKVGKVVGRQRRYDELGENEIEPIRELFLLRHLTGKHWPGLSKDMEAYYEKFYFTRPKKGSKDYDKHVKCWERRTRWIAAHTAPSTATV